DLADAGAELGVDGGRRRLLDELLVAALDRAVALAEVDHVAVSIREDLDLDVTRILEEPLDVDGRVGEVRLALASSGLEGASRFIPAADDLQALSASTRGRFHGEREAELLAEPEDGFRGVDRLRRPGNDRHAGRAHPLPGSDLRAHRLDRLGRGADPDESRCGAGFGEGGVLREEPIARMDGLRSAATGDVEQALLVEVALGRRPRAEEIGLVRDGRVERRAIRLGVDRDRLDPELPERTEDADRDLAAVRDEHLRERGHRAYSLRTMDLPDQLTVARAAAVPLVVILYAWSFEGHDYWATTLFVVAMATDWFDGRIARSRGRTSSLGSLLDPMADKVLVLAVLVMLVDADVVPGWMVAAIVARELLVSGLRLAALERGVVLHARDLGKLKTWSQAIAAAVGGFAAA